MKPLLIFQIRSLSLYKEMTFKILIQDGTKLHWLQEKIPKDNVLESVYRMRIREPVQLQTVFAMFEQLIDQHLRSQIDQTIRTRNFRARNERIKTGVLLKSQKGKMSGRERQVGKCFQWKANGQCSRGDS